MNMDDIKSDIINKPKINDNIIGDINDIDDIDNIDDINKDNNDIIDDIDDINKDNKDDIDDKPKKMTVYDILENYKSNSSPKKIKLRTKSKDKSKDKSNNKGKTLKEIKEKVESIKRPYQLRKKLFKRKLVAI